MLPLAPIAVTFDAVILHEVTDASSNTFYAWPFDGAGFVLGAFAKTVTGFAMTLLSRKSVPTSIEQNQNNDLLGE
jgi:hypothetical protein